MQLIIKFKYDEFKRIERQLQKKYHSAAGLPVLVKRLLRDIVNEGSEQARITTEELNYDEVKPCAE